MCKVNSPEANYNMSMSAGKIKQNTLKIYKNKATAAMMMMIDL
jgi:hypothetical protein